MFRLLMQSSSDRTPTKKKCGYFSLACACEDCDINLDMNLIWCVIRRFRKISESDYVLRNVSLSAWNNSALTGRIFIKFGIYTLRKSVGKIQVSLKSEKNNGSFT
jgi:hypothetical protein